jgi:hypothetical protein
MAQDPTRRIFETFVFEWNKNRSGQNARQLSSAARHALVEFSIHCNEDDSPGGWVRSGTPEWQVKSSIGDRKNG